MKAKIVLKILNISRVTLSNYVKQKKIKVIKLDNGYYEYDNNDVFLLKGIKNRKTIAYCRVSTKKQKKDLEKQTEFILQYCINKNITVDEIFKDIDSGMTLDRDNLSILLDMITSYQVETIVISDKDRLTRNGYKVFSDLCDKFFTKIIVINESKNDENELLQEIVSIIHSFSMKFYSSRKRKRMEIIKETLNLDNEFDEADSSK